MTKTYKRTYFDLAMQQPADYLRAVLRNPNYPYMRPIHLALIALALRHKQKRAV